MSGADLFWLIIICTAIVSFAAVRIVRVITNNWRHMS
jgi:hypothetical protein